MNSNSLPAPTKSQSKNMEALVDKIGCAVCLFCLKIEDSPGCIHHLLEGGQRISHDAIIPLCHKHHQDGAEGRPSRHSVNGLHGGLDVFEKTYMPEWELLERCEAWIDNYYYTNSLTDD